MMDLLGAVLPAPIPPQAQLPFPHFGSEPNTYALAREAPSPEVPTQ
jgi:hypothetical protein